MGDRFVVFYVCAKNGKTSKSGRQQMENRRQERRRQNSRFRWPPRPETLFKKRRDFLIFMALTIWKPYKFQGLEYLILLAS